MSRLPESNIGRALARDWSRDDGLKARISGETEGGIQRGDARFNADKDAWCLERRLESQLVLVVLVEDLSILFA